MSETLLSRSLFIEWAVVVNKVMLELISLWYRLRILLLLIIAPGETR